MSKGLEALEDIILYLNANEPKGLYCENIEVIKNDLDRLEKYKKVIEILFGENGAVLLGSDNKHKLHLINYELVKYFISKEKYDLLKEVIECPKD